MSTGASDASAHARKRAFRADFAVLFSCLVSVGMGQSMLFSVLPPAAREIGISPFQVSTIFATSASIWVFVSPAWGRRSDRAGRRRIIIVGLLGYALSMALIATVIEIGTRHLLPAIAVYPMLVASRCVFALLGSGTGPASQAFIADRTSREERTAGVALVSAAMGLGETIGPGVGALLSVIDLVTPIYFAAALAVASAASIGRWLPEAKPHAHPAVPHGRRMRVFDRRILPFLLVSTSLQAARGTTVVTLAFFLQDVLRLSPPETVRASGVGFVVLAASGLIAQLGIVQRVRPSARALMRAGAACMLVAFSMLVVGRTLPVFLVALALLGMGLGLVRPGAAAAASLAVGTDEQGAAAGILGGVAVVGNIFGPMIGTAIYEASHTGPYLVNAAMMAVVLAFVLVSRRIRSVHV
ncbi:MAG TPA: MFS transporter [Candidatus Binatia bacterium]|nr:MFS transporter [Candidatus Binatia bacterium]